MKEKLKRLPRAIQKQIFYRMGIGFIFALSFIFTLIFYRDLYIILPCFICSAFFILNGLWIYHETNAGKYVVVEGHCSGLERTSLRKRIKNIYIETDAVTVKILVKQRIKQLAIGDNIRVYIFKKTPVYDQEQCKLLCSYLALEKTRKGKENDDSSRFIADFGGDQEINSGKFR